MKTKIRFWLENARWASLVQSLMPSLTAVVMCIKKEEFSVLLSVLAMIGVACAHLSCNLLDDYFDYRSHETGYRDTLSRAGFNAYTAKCPYIVNGSATLGNLFTACVVFAVAAVFCGLVVFIRRGSVILVITAVTAAIGFFYSAPPVRLSYHGLGELCIGVIFGLLNMAGTAAAACGQITSEILTAGVVFGILVINILYTHSVIDFAADQSVKKITLAALLKNENQRYFAVALFNFIPYGLILLSVILRKMSPWYLLAFLVLPYSVELYRLMRLYRTNPKAPVVWKKWYGGSAGIDWKQADQAGLSWFLVRWLLSRNIVAYFAVAFAAASILV